MTVFFFATNSLSVIYIYFGVYIMESWLILHILLNQLAALVFFVCSCDWIVFACWACTHTIL